MGQALYRKYRSTSLSEIVGQEHITTALAQALKTGRISHAYLFTGPRGSGKTSIARIMAYAINGLPYSKEPHLDIIEIDAASNRRIDEIRDLRDKVYIAPASAKYKVYIIDEVHMLTREAFNALLKTLEEPPEHVVFMLATTDAHKLPETIISRTQRYTFRPVEARKVAEHLKHIAKQEKIKADDEALRLLAEHGEGSFRDSISMLDQVSNHDGDVTAEVVRQHLGLPPEQSIKAVLDSLDSGDIAGPVAALQALYDEGYRAAGIAEQLARSLRESLTRGTASGQRLALLRNLLEVPGAHNPERYLELVLMDASAPSAQVAQTAAAPAQLAQPAEPASSKPAPASKPAATKGKPEASETKPAAPSPKPAGKPKKAGPVLRLTDDDWANVLALLKKQYNTIYGIVRMAHTDFSEPAKVQLSFTFAFHQKRINDAKNRKIVTDAIEEVTGQLVELVCIIDTAPKPRATQPADTLQDISSVFGGGELL